MRNILITVLFSLMIYGCTESTNPLNTIPDTSPMWPMPGYNARNTSSPYAPDAIMNPVATGTPGWSYTFPLGDYQDGGQFCVDSRGFIYYLHQIYPLGALYKFSPDGQVLWKRDSLMQWNFAAISISRDESQIFFVAFKPGTWDRLYCLDSAGNYLWYKDSALVTKPAIGKDDVIYSFHMNGLIAYTKEGNALWTNTSVKGNAAHNYIALDREDNIYTVNQPGKYVKVSKHGDLKWEYTAVNSLFGLVIDGFGNLYFNGFSDDKFYCINNSGQLKWTKQNVNAYTTPVITSDNRIIVSSGGYVISYDTSGAEVWRCQPFTNLSGAEGLLLDDNNNVYYIGDGNSIYAGSISANGVKRWDVSTNLFGSLPPPVLLPQGRMVVAPKRANRIQAVN